MMWKQLGVLWKQIDEQSSDRFELGGQVTLSLCHVAALVLQLRAVSFDAYHLVTKFFQVVFCFLHFGQALSLFLFSQAPRCAAPHALLGCRSYLGSEDWVAIALLL
jgi:hypothetical protein